jgi:outer membrane immunogenic protein
MKKLILALTAIAAFSGSALAADLPARTYTKAPVMPEPVQNWTGFYLFGGFGYGLWEADTHTVDPFTGLCDLCVEQRQGGKGWYGTVGGGYDWQFNGRWVAGILADGQFGNIRGTIQDQSPFSVGREELKDTWAVGARIGYLVAPNVLSYVNGGYTGANWSGTTLVDSATGAPSNGNFANAHTNSFNSTGWFIGGGVENSFDFFGINFPGLFMKTEYRVAQFGTTQIGQVSNATGLPVLDNISFHPVVQTVSTSLVYRFNWGGPPVAARY